MTPKRSAGLTSPPYPHPRSHQLRVLQKFVVEVALRDKVYCCCFLLLLCTNLAGTDPTSSVSVSPSVTNKVASASSLLGPSPSWGDPQPRFSPAQKLLGFHRHEQARKARLRGSEPAAPAGCVSLFPAGTGGVWGAARRVSIQGEVINPSREESCSQRSLPGSQRCSGRGACPTAAHAHPQEPSPNTSTSILLPNKGKAGREMLGGEAAAEGGAPELCSPQGRRGTEPHHPRAVRFLPQVPSPLSPGVRHDGGESPAAPRAQREDCAEPMDGLAAEGSRPRGCPHRR